MLQRLKSWRACVEAYPTIKKDIWQHLAVDYFVGLGWLLMSSNRTAGPVYNQAKALLSAPPEQMRQYGAMLTGLAILLTLAIVFRLGAAYDVARIGLIFFWAFFAAIFFLGFSDGVSSTLSIAWGVAWAWRTLRMARNNPWSEMD